ncbi:MAG TPA: HAD-IC family P-type ATPase, partial [Steroidobacteraceae bacterium]|nr:HAD-IC family P-type ATPase [Steroidobacteraceae bacterium]
MISPRPQTDPNRAPAAGEPHACSREDLLTGLQTRRDGLSRSEAAERLQACGPNELPTGPELNLAVVVLRQLKSPLIYVLLAAAVVSIALGHLTDAAFIGVVLVVNTAIGTWQEWTAERESAALKKMLEVRATVIRDGVRTEVDSSQVVPGDIVSLESGQRIPADLRLLTTQSLEVDESQLNGASLAVAKDAEWLGEKAVVLADRRNMAYAGSSVTRGRALGAVVATGADTELGRIATAMAATQGGKAPLVQRMERFGRFIALVVVGSAVVIGATAVLVHGRGLAEVFVLAVALAVAAVPQGLPVALSVALAIAARRMADRGAIVRQLPAVEGLGSCSLIATDKTGTLTCNELTVRELEVPGEMRFAVSGAGYVPEGQIQGPDGKALQAADDERLARLLEIGVACNEGGLARDGEEWTTRGDPTDIALLVVAVKAGVDLHEMRERHPQIDAIPFESERRYAATFHDRAEGPWVAVKGAPESVIGMCSLAAGESRAIRDAAADMARRGLRVLAFASGSTSQRPTGNDAHEAPSGLEFAGLAGLIDPVRPGVREAVAACHTAGIAVKMVTGDHPVTALAIARDVGITDDETAVREGAELSEISPTDLPAVVDRTAVFARVTPEQKIAIVQAAQQHGHFVAVTGDGVNDAPALRGANIGVAMGRSGTDVARDASDLVITDDNFATIVAGVKQGRIAYTNVRNEVYLLIAAGIAEVATIGIAVIAGLPIPLLPVQILWLNVVTNGIQDVALAFEKGAGDELARPARRPSEPLVDRVMLSRGLLAGGWMTAVALGTFVMLLESGVPLEEARNALLLLMTLMQNVDAWNASSESRCVLAIPPRNNPVLTVGVLGAIGAHLLAMNLPVLQNVLHTAPVAMSDWVLYGAMAL